MLNVLIVEDNAEYRESLHHLLAEHFPSLRITEAADAQAALRQALAPRFDLIFMDIRLPQGNGLDLTGTIKSVCSGSVVCVISSHAVAEYREAAFRNGADHFMVKGEATGVEIVGLVESWLKERTVA